MNRSAVIAKNTGPIKLSAWPVSIARNYPRASASFFFALCKNAFGIPKVTLLKTPKFQKAEETSSNGEVKLITADTGCIEMIIQSGTIRSLQRKLQCHVGKLKC